MIDHEMWKTYKLIDIFDITYGNKFDLCALNETDNKSEESVAFITRTATNNGIGAYVERTSTPPYNSGAITVALGGSLGATFVQNQQFYTSQNIAVLLPKVEYSNNITTNVKLFIITLIKQECRLKFTAFGRELNKHIKTDFTTERFSMPGQLEI